MEQTSRQLVEQAFECLERGKRREPGAKLNESEIAKEFICLGVKFGSIHAEFGDEEGTDGVAFTFAGWEPFRVPYTEGNPGTMRTILAQFSFIVDELRFGGDPDDLIRQSIRVSDEEIEEAAQQVVTYSEEEWWRVYKSPEIVNRTHPFRVALPRADWLPRVDWLPSDDPHERDRDAARSFLKRRKVHEAGLDYLYDRTDTHRFDAVVTVDACGQTGVPVRIEVNNDSLPYSFTITRLGE